MTISYAWYGATADSIRLAARCDSNGDVTLTLSDGRTLTETVDTAVNDGVVLFAFSASSNQTGTLSHGGTEYEHTMQIRPLPTDSLRVIHWSCGSDENRLFHALDVMDSLDPDLVICLGDLVYADASSGTYNGETQTDVSRLHIRTVGPEAYRTHFRSVMKSPSFKRLYSRAPFWMMWDDHEIFDGWDGGINMLNKFYTLNGAPYIEQGTTAAHAVEVYNIARQVFENEVACVNPRNADAVIDADALYFRCRVGNLVEFVTPDLMSYKDLSTNRNGNLYVDTKPYYASADDPLRSFMYPAQKAWFKGALDSAQADGVSHKIACMTKQMYQHNADAANNGDTFAAQATVERDELVAHAGGIDSLVYLSHDTHQPAVYYNEAYGWIGINACSVSSGLHQQGTGYNTNVAWKAWGYAGDPTALRATACRYVFGMIEIDSEKQVHSMLDAHTARVVWGPHTVSAGQPAYPGSQQRFG